MELADFFGVGEHTLNDWKKNHREFCSPKKKVNPRQTPRSPTSSSSAQLATAILKKNSFQCP